MLSVLITDESKIFKDHYVIPQNISYRDLRVERVILGNNWDNIMGNTWTVSVDGVDKSINIPDGRYNESDYSEYLQQYLGANTDNVQWYVTFNVNTNKFNIRADNNSAKDVRIKPNDSAFDVTGFPETVYPKNSHIGINGDEKATFVPSYVLIKSSTLNHNSYAFKEQTSNIIAFVPLDTYQTNSLWQETTTFQVDSVNLKTIGNQVDIRFYLGGKTLIVDPIFSMELTFM